MKLQGKTIWVTEACGALGAELVRALADAGNFVIASGVDGSQLRALVARSRGAVMALPLGASAPAASGGVVRVGEQVVECSRLCLGEYTDRLDIVVCGSAARGAEAPPSRHAAPVAMELALLVPMRLIEVALPLLQRGRSPYLVCLCTAPVRGERADVSGAAGVALASFARSLSGSWPGAVAVSVAQFGPGDYCPEHATSAILAGMARRKAVIRVGRPAGVVGALAGRWRVRHEGSTWGNGVTG